MDTGTDQGETSSSMDESSNVEPAMSPSELHNAMVNQPGYREAVRSLFPDGSLDEASAEPSVISSDEEERLRQNRRISARELSRENKSGQRSGAVNGVADGRRKSRSKSSKASTSSKSCSVDMAIEQFDRLNLQVWTYLGVI
jgi:hypothetical protein